MRYPPWTAVSAAKPSPTTAHPAVTCCYPRRRAPTCAPRPPRAPVDWVLGRPPAPAGASGAAPTALVHRASSRAALGPGRPFGAASRPGTGGRGLAAPGILSRRRRGTCSASLATPGHRPGVVAAAGGRGWPSPSGPAAPAGPPSSWRASWHSWRPARSQRGAHGCPECWAGCRGPRVVPGYTQGWQGRRKDPPR